MVDNVCCVCHYILDTEQEGLNEGDAGMMLASLFSYFTANRSLSPSNIIGG